MQSEIPLLWPTICANDSSVSVRYKEDAGTNGGTDDGNNTSSVVMPSDTGATAGPAVPTQTSKDVTPSVSGAPVDQNQTTSSAFTTPATAMTAPTASTAAVVPIGGAIINRASTPFSIVGLAMLVGGAIMI